MCTMKVFVQRLTSRQDINCLNALLVVNKIRQIMNDRWKSFVFVLRFIRRWARNRNINSSLFGFLGGISWTLLVVRVFVENPEIKDDQQMVHQFFKQTKELDIGTIIDIRKYFNSSSSLSSSSCSASSHSSSSSSLGQKKNLSLHFQFPQDDPNNYHLLNNLLLLHSIVKVVIL